MPRGQTCSRRRCRSAFPQTNLQAGKRRPALVVADLIGDDLILCQITKQSRSDNYSISLTDADLTKGKLAVASFARANRLFTVERSVILYVAAHVSDSKLTEVKARIHSLFA